MCIRDRSYSDLQEAVKAAESGDTIELGVGDYTLYKVDSTDTTKGKNLTLSLIHIYPRKSVFMQAVL